MNKSIHPLNKFDESSKDESSVQKDFQRKSFKIRGFLDLLSIKSLQNEWMGWNKCCVYVIMILMESVPGPSFTRR